MTNFEDYPWIYPPPGFIPVERCRSVPVPNGSNLVEVMRIEIPTRMDGWINLAGIELTVFDDNDAFYRINQAGVPIRDYSKLSAPLGAPNTPAALYLRLFPDQPLTLHVTNNTGQILAARYRVYGWYYPQRNTAGLARRGS